jgi:hypothetical protein
MSELKLRPPKLRSKERTPAALGMTTESTFFANQEAATYTDRFMQILKRPTTALGLPRDAKALAQKIQEWRRATRRASLILRTGPGNGP